MLASPPGFFYRRDLVTEPEEAEFAAYLRTLDFASIEMRGQVARRRTVHFGWVYGYESWRIEPGPPIPEVLLPLRARAASLANVDPDALVEVLTCRMRFRPGSGATGETRALVLEPRSAYVLDGAVRWAWQHSISPMKAPRYSITFRTLKTPVRLGPHAHAQR
jgi:alkylated DNA repair protein (DNA oxidative demethylase)